MGNEMNTIKETDISAVTVSAKVLTRIIGLTERRIRQLAEEGILVRAGKGRYRLEESLKNYILTLKVAIETGGVDNPDGELNLEEEKAMHEKVKRHISELKLQTMKGELHKSDDVKHVMTEMIVSIKTKLLSLPSKISPLLLSRDDVGYIKGIITKEVVEALNELKDYNANDFYSDEYVANNEEDVNAEFE